MPGTQAAFIKPNLYQLQGHHLHVSYSTSGIDGKPHFTYQDVHGSQSFSGADIRTVETEIGTLVTVSTVRTNDTGYTSFSVLIPVVNLDAATVGISAIVHTTGITTIHKFSVLHFANEGQVENYSFTPLSGTARQVFF